MAKGRINIRDIDHIDVSSSTDEGDMHCGDAYAFLEASPPHQYDAIIADPPYEIGIAGKDWDFEKLRIDILAYQFHRVLKPDSNVFVFCSDFQFGEWYHELSKYFTKLRKFAWCKPDAPGYNHGQFQESFELGLHASFENSYFEPVGFYRNYIEQGKTSGNERIMPDPDEKRSKAKGQKSLHPTQKSLTVVEGLVTALTKTGDTILDPFAGTGTLAEAAKNLGRKYETVEYSHRYYIAARFRL